MTGDDLRWPRDSQQEDDEVKRATDLGRLEVWIREQKLRPLVDALAEHGVQLDPDGEVVQTRLVMPSWWDEIAEPHDQCPWCQRPGVPAPCPECRQSRAADVDPPAAWARWAALTPAQRRLHIASAYGVDPWSGRRCVIRVEWTDVDQDGQILTTYPPYFGSAVAGIYWGEVRRA